VGHFGFGGFCSTGELTSNFVLGISAESVHARLSQPRHFSTSLL
jgi:hypothetical protein